MNKLVERLKKQSVYVDCGWMEDAADKMVWQARRIEELEDALTGASINFATSRYSSGGAIDAIHKVLNTN